MDHLCEFRLLSTRISWTEVSSRLFTVFFLHTVCLSATVSAPPFIVSAMSMGLLGQARLSMWTGNVGWESQSESLELSTKNNFSF